MGCNTLVGLQAGIASTTTYVMDPSNSLHCMSFPVNLLVIFKVNTAGKQQQQQHPTTVTEEVMLSQT
jgi:hypothetical protein